MHTWPDTYVNGLHEIVIRAVPNILTNPKQILYATHSQPNFRFACYPINYSAQPTPMRIPVATYLYYIAKIVDLLDTVFFILRKKNGHVSFLHIYHHSMMVAAMYVAVNFMPGGHSWLLAMINSLVHVVMYAYYLFASVRPAAASLGDWKRLVTQIQMVSPNSRTICGLQFIHHFVIIQTSQVQFVMLASHYAYGLAQSNCGDYPRPALLIGVIQNAFVFLMFADFYRRNYMKDDHNTSIVFAIQAQFHSFVHFVKNLFRPPNTNQ